MIQVVLDTINSMMMMMMMMVVVVLMRPKQSQQDSFSKKTRLQVFGDQLNHKHTNNKKHRLQMHRPTVDVTGCNLF